MPTVTPTSHALLLSSNNRRSGPKARNSSGEITTGPVNGGDHAGTTMNAGTTNDDMSITSNEADGSGKVTTSEGHHVDAPKVQTRADSAQTIPTWSFAVPVLSSKGTASCETAVPDHIKD